MDVPAFPTLRQAVRRLVRIFSLGEERRGGGFRAGGRGVLRCVGAVIGAFHNAVPAETEMFLTTLLASRDGDGPWRRSYTLEVIKATVVDGNLARFLHGLRREGRGQHKIFRG